MPGKIFKMQVRVTWADTDAAQVVHFSRYFVFFERAEEEFYNSLGLSFKILAEKGLWLPRVEAFCQYKKPARFNDILEIGLVIEELGGKSVRFGFEVVKKETGDLLATGHFVVVTADRKTGRATQIPWEFEEKLRPFVG